MVKAVFDELAKDKPEAPLHRRHRRRRDAHVAAVGSVVPDRARRTCRRRCSTASAPTARSAPTRTRSRSSARKPSSTRRATSSTTRRSPARSPSRTCARASGRSARPTWSNRAGFVACHQFEFVDKIDVLEHAAPGAAFLLNAPFPADEVWDHLPTRDAGADHREEAPLLRDRRLRAGQASRAWARASTRSCRPASSRSPACCRATRRSRTSRRRSRRPTASAGRRSCAATARSSIRRSRTCTRFRCRPRSRAAHAGRRWCRSRRPTSSRR